LTKFLNANFTNELPRATQALASGASTPQARSNSLPDKAKLKFGHCAQNLAQQTACRSAEIKVVAQADERDPERLKFC